jgi:hypothetical protein
MVIGVNITTAIYNLIPLPPLAMGHLACELLFTSESRAKWLLLQGGPYLVLALALLERINHRSIFSPYFDPIIKVIYATIVGS